MCNVGPGGGSPFDVTLHQAQQEVFPLHTPLLTVLAPVYGQWRS